MNRIKVISCSACLLRKSQAVSRRDIEFIAYDIRNRLTKIKNFSEYERMEISMEGGGSGEERTQDGSRSQDNLVGAGGRRIMSSQSGNTAHNNQGVIELHISETEQNTPGKNRTH